MDHFEEEIKMRHFQKLGTIPLVGGRAMRVMKVLALTLLLGACALGPVDPHGPDTGQDPIGDGQNQN